MRGKPAVRNDKRGWRKRGQDLMAICHNARKGRHTGSHWSKPVAPPLHSTSQNPCASALLRPSSAGLQRRTQSPKHEFCTGACASDRRFDVPGRVLPCSVDVKGPALAAFRPESRPEESGNSPCKSLPMRFHGRRCGANFAKPTVHGAVHAPQDNNNYPLKHYERRPTCYHGEVARRIQ
jgi:hypothetical protein